MICTQGFNLVVWKLETLQVCLPLERINVKLRNLGVKKREFMKISVSDDVTREGNKIL